MIISKNILARTRSPRGKWDDSGTRALRGDLGTCEKNRWPPAPPCALGARWRRLRSATASSDARSLRGTTSGIPAA
eukprot:scaffold77_cov116-Isochrysis_galbana.AAC.3